MKISRGDLLYGCLWMMSAICLSIPSSTSALADCPAPRFASITQAVHFFMGDSPIIFVGKVLKTRLIKKATKKTAPIFEDEYAIKDTIRGSDLGSKVFLEVGTVGDGDESPDDPIGEQDAMES